MSLSTETPDDPNDSSYKDKEDDNTSASHSIINSGDYTFNINNAYELDSSSFQDMVDNINEGTIDTIAMPSLDSTSSIPDMDIPISQLMNDGSTIASTESSEAESISTVNGTQLFQLQDSYKRTVQVMFTQMSAHKGIKLFGQKVLKIRWTEWYF